jgi:acetyl-CoA acetyltransferase family protein
MLVSQKKSPQKTPKLHTAALIEGVRTPFLRSNGAYTSLMAHDLGRLAVAGLLSKTGVSPEEIDLVTMGTVVFDPRTPNVAREITLGAGLPEKTPAYTTTMACISSNVAATQITDGIRLGNIEMGIAGGTDTLSDPPIRLSKNLRQALVRLQKAKGPADYFKVLSDLGPKDILPDIPSASEFSTGLTMGQSCERAAKTHQVTREETDAFAAMSHQRAATAWEEGIYAQEIVPVHVPPHFKTLTEDNGPRGDTTVEKLKKIKPAFDRQFGVSTAGNSSFLTDGASAVLFASLDKCKELSLKPKALMVDHVLTGANPLDELLMGPAISIPQLLHRNGLKVGDIDVWEIHEAFAAQMVFNLKCLASKEFAQQRLGMDEPVGDIPMDKLNIWGGSLSLGHPFGATGGRLLNTAARRLQEKGGRYAVVSGCAAGGQGSAILLQHPEA